MKDHRITKLDKILVSVLDKIPDQFGVLLDENGWLKIKDLFFAIKDEDGIGHITPNNIEFYVNQFLSEKYEIHDNKIRIKPDFRTNHIEIEECVIPPSPLYVCIRERAYDHVLNYGLETNAENTPFILTTDKELALKLGKKISNDPVLVEIYSEDAANRGIQFYKYGCLYLSYYIPKKFISLPPRKAEEISERQKQSPNIKSEKKSDGNKVKERKPKDEKSTPKTQPNLGSYYMSLKDMLPHLFVHQNDRDKGNKTSKKRDKEPSWKEARREKEKKWRD